MNFENHQRRDFLKLAGGAAASVFAGSAFAASTWPDQPVRFVVPYTPGGGTDVVSRTLTTKIGTDNKWTFVVDNKPGANGSIGMEAIQKAKPDGLTLGMGQTSNLALNPWLYSRLSYDANALRLVALVSSQPLILVTSSKSDIYNMTDFIKAAKSKQGGLKHALAGSGSLGQMASEMMGAKYGFNVLNVPYRGTGPALPDLIGGATDFTFAAPPPVLELIKVNKLRAIAVTSPTRFALLPDVPTIAEVDFPGFSVLDWKAIVAPKATPEAILKRMNEATNRALQSPEVVASLSAEGSALLGGDMAKAEAFVLAERTRWGGIIKHANIKLD